MLENMSGFVGQAAHLERQRQAHERLRRAETTGQRPATGRGKRMNKEVVMFSNRVKLTTVIALLAALCVALPLVGASSDFSTNDQATDATTIGQGWCDAWNSLDVDRFATAFTDDIFYDDVPAGTVSHNSAEVRAYAQSYYTAIPDFHFDCTATRLADGHGSIEWVGSGTDDATNGFYKTGKRFSVQGVSLIEVRDGKISRSIDYYDEATAMRQLGLIP